MASKKQKKVSNEEVITKIIIGIIVFVIMLVAVLKLGAVGIFLNNILKYLCGELYYVPVISILILCFYFVFLQKKYKLEIKMIAGVSLLNIAVILWSAMNEAEAGISGFGIIKSYLSLNPMLFSDNTINYGGGILGAFFYSLTSSLFDKTGTLIVVIAIFLIALLLIIPFDTYMNILNSVSSKNADLKNRRQVKKLAKENEKRERLEKMAIEENERLKRNDFKFIDYNSSDINKEETDNVIKRRKDSLFIDIKDSSTTKEENPKIDLIEKPEDTVKVAENNDVPHILKEDHFISYKLPGMNVFENVSSSKSGNINKTSADVKGKKIIEILNNFGIEATLINTHIGPSVTKFEIKPDSSVKVSKILNIQDNIKMELAARDIRIEAPIPGRNAVGIEIPNVEPIPVKMQELVKMLPPNKKDKQLLFFLGKDLMGKLVTCEIDRMPHLLIAGATGSGKSVCINAIITSLLYRTNPRDVKLVLVDPKKVEFTPYHDVPHLLWPVITDAVMANNMLKKVVVMMEGRFDIFAEAGVRNITAYNDAVEAFNKTNTDPEKEMKKMPYIVVIIDELADLMMIAGKEVEASIQRITQLARASGIHLIVATQRPSTDVITGIIKSNIPSRISFSVASSIDSRTILDQTGAERLLGNGDMLYFPQGETSPIRLQGVFVTDNEVKNITSYVKKQAKPEYDDAYFEFLNLNNAGGQVSNSRQDKDSLYDEVKEYVIESQKASTSLLQRRFGIGYNRAAGLIEALEDNGIVGPQNGSKPREVYIKKESDSD